MVPTSKNFVKDAKNVMNNKEAQSEAEKGLSEWTETDETDGRGTQEPNIQTAREGTPTPREKNLFGEEFQEEEDESTRHPGRRATALE